MLGEQLLKLRKARGLKQRDMSKMLGISTSAYGFYEQGKREPELKTLEKLADFFDVSVDALLGRAPVLTLPERQADAKLLPEEAQGELDIFVDYLKHKYAARA